jgi:hypothetical protein
LNDVETAALAGSARGFESLARTVRAKKLPPLGERTWDLLRWAATAQRVATDPRSALTRRLAMAALVTGNQATTSVIERGLNDTDAEVPPLRRCRGRDRCKARRARSHHQDRPGRQGTAGALRALRAWGRHFQNTSCAPIRAALKDPNPHVMLQAIDQLGSACPAAESPPPI